MVVDCCLFVVCCLLFAVKKCGSLFDVACWSLFVECWLLGCCWWLVLFLVVSLVLGCCSFVVVCSCWLLSDVVDSCCLSLVVC